MAKRRLRKSTHGKNKTNTGDEESHSAFNVNKDLRKSNVTANRKKDVKRKATPAKMCQANHEEYSEMKACDFMLSQSGAEVIWNDTPNIGNQDGTSNIEDLVRKFTHDNEACDEPPGTPPLVSLWMDSPSGCNEDTRQSEVRHRVTRKAKRLEKKRINKVDPTNILKKLTAVLEANSGEKENSASRRHADLNNRAATQKPEVPMRSSPLESTCISPILQHSQHHSQVETSPQETGTRVGSSIIDTPKSALKSFGGSIFKGTPKSASKNQSGDELWTDEELFENDSFLVATQMGAADDRTPSPRYNFGKRRLATPTGGEKKRQTFKLETSPLTWDNNKNSDGTVKKNVFKKPDPVTPSSPYQSSSNVSVMNVQTVTTESKDSTTNNISVSSASTASFSGTMLYSSSSNTLNSNLIGDAKSKNCSSNIVANSTINSSCTTGSKYANQHMISQSTIDKKDTFVSRTNTFGNVSSCVSRPPLPNNKTVNHMQTMSTLSKMQDPQNMSKAVSKPHRFMNHSITDTKSTQSVVTKSQQTPYNSNTALVAGKAPQLKEKGSFLSRSTVSTLSSTTVNMNVASQSNPLISAPSSILSVKQCNNTSTFSKYTSGTPKYTQASLKPVNKLGNNILPKASACNKAKSPNDYTTFHAKNLVNDSVNINNIVQPKVTSTVNSSSYKSTSFTNKTVGPEFDMNSSISEELLAALAEPDDLLDSQVCMFDESMTDSQITGKCNSDGVENLNNVNHNESEKFGEHNKNKLSSNMPAKVNKNKTTRNSFQIPPVQRQPAANIKTDDIVDSSKNNNKITERKGAIVCNSNIDVNTGKSLKSANNSKPVAVVKHQPVSQGMSHFYKPVSHHVKNKTTGFAGYSANSNPLNNTPAISKGQTKEMSNKPVQGSLEHAKNSTYQMPKKTDPSTNCVSVSKNLTRTQLKNVNSLYDSQLSNVSAIMPLATSTQKADFRLTQNQQTSSPPGKFAFVKPLKKMSPVLPFIPPTVSNTVVTVGGQHLPTESINKFQVGHYVPKCPINNFVVGQNGLKGQTHKLDAVPNDPIAPNNNFAVEQNMHKPPTNDGIFSQHVQKIQSNYGKSTSGSGSSSSSALAASKASTVILSENMNCEEDCELGEDDLLALLEETESQIAEPNSLPMAGKNTSNIAVTSNDDTVVHNKLSREVKTSIMKAESNQKNPQTLPDCTKQQDIVLRSNQHTFQYEKNRGALTNKYHDTKSKGSSELVQKHSTNHMISRQLSETNLKSGGNQHNLTRSNSSVNKIDAITSNCLASDNRSGQLKRNISNAQVTKNRQVKPSEMMRTSTGDPIVKPFQNYNAVKTVSNSDRQKCNKLDLNSSNPPVKKSTRSIQKFPSYDTLNIHDSPKAVISNGLSSSQESGKSGVSVCSPVEIEKKRMEALKRRQSKKS